MFANRISFAGSPICNDFWAFGFHPNAQKSLLVDRYPFGDGMSIQNLEGETKVIPIATQSV